MELDGWQKQVMETEGNICLRSGRQVGKSTIISIKAGDYALTHAKQNIMVIASVERQAQLLFEKILSYIYETNRTMIKKGKDRPTKHKLILKNGSTIHCLPTGESGYGIRGFTINLLIADEAAFISEDVWIAVTPMLTITRGDIWLLSTPHGKDGYYYRCFQDDKFTPFHVSSEDCPRKDQSFLDHEKEWMTKAQYAQEYLGEFVDDLRQFFSNGLIKKSCTLKRRKSLSPMRDYFLGVDIARLGKDTSTFEILERDDNDKLFHVENIVQRQNLTTETTRKIISLDQDWDFIKVYIDSAGVGAGVLDQLLEEDDIKRKVVSIENARKSIDNKNTAKKTILKNDLYNNLLRMMEMNKITLLNDEDIKVSLKSVQYEYGENGKMYIWGKDTHIVEGLIRAAWCVKDKTLKPFVYY
jgi:hypothetical protein